jgi:hypothetical protein
MHFLWLAPAAIKQNLGATIRAIGGEVCSIMMPASVLMAVSVYDRASDSMCPS